MPGIFKALVLSKGEQFEKTLWPREYGYTQWPEGSECYSVFYDSASGVIAQVDAYDVAPEKITFDSDPSEVDHIPVGAHYETFLIDDEAKPKMLEYGQMIRKQAYFRNTPAFDISNRALQFRDDFYGRTGLVGSKWFATLGRPTIFDNSDDGDPNGVGPSTIFFADAAMRFYAPLNTDTWLLSFSLLNPGAGKTGVVVGSNAAMTSYLYVMFESGISNNRLHMGRGAGPIALIDQVPTVSHTVVDNTNYKLRYDNDTRQLALLNSAMTTTLISWTDTGAIVPHGPGYRYFGVNWQASLLSSGVQLTTISAQDGLV